MKIKVDKEAMAKCLDIVTKALESKTILPINSCIKMVIKRSTCYVCCRSEALQIKGQFKVLSSEDFEMCIPGETFLRTIKLLDDKEINLNYNSKKFVLNISAEKKRYKITGVDPSNFRPQKVMGDNLTVFKTMSQMIMPYIKSASSIADWNEMRLQICGVTIATSNGEIYVSGVDNGSTLYKAMTDIKVNNNLAVVIPKDITMALKDMSGNGEFIAEIGRKSIEITLDGFKLLSTLNNVDKVLSIDGFFEHDKEKYIVVDKMDLIMGCRRLRSFSSGDNTLMKIELKGSEITMRAENSEYGKDGEEIVDIVNKDCKDVSIGFNINKLLNMLSTVNSDKIKMFIEEKNKPMRISRHDTNYSNEQWCLAPVYTP